MKKKAQKCTHHRHCLAIAYLEHLEAENVFARHVYGLSITDYHHLLLIQAAVNHKKHALAVTPAETRPYVDELPNDDEKHLFNRQLDCIERNEWSLMDAE